MDLLTILGNLFLGEVLGVIITVFFIDALFGYRERRRDLDVTRRLLSQIQREISLQYHIFAGSPEKRRIERIETQEQAYSWKQSISLLRRRFPITTAYMTNPLVTRRAELLDELWSSVEVLHREIAKAEMVAWYQARELDTSRQNWQARRWLPEFDTAPAGDMSFEDYDKPFDEIPMTEVFDRLEDQFRHILHVINQALAEDVSFLRLVREENLVARALR